MSSHSKVTHGAALRELGGKVQVEVQLRQRDFNVQILEDPATGEKKSLPVDCLIAFSTVGYREVGEVGSDLWEFRTMVPSPGGPVTMFIYLRGEDILQLRTISRLA